MSSFYGAFHDKIYQHLTLVFSMSLCRHFFLLFYFAVILFADFDKTYILKDPKLKCHNYQLENTMRKNLLNWCNLVSISKNVVFYTFGVVRHRIY